MSASRNLTTSYIIYNNIPYPLSYELPLKVSNDTIMARENIKNPDKVNKYEDFVCKLLDENKKLLDLVDFQKQEILNMHKNMKELKDINRYLDDKNTYNQKNGIEVEENVIGKEIEQKYSVLINDLNEKNQMLLYDNEKLEENNKVYLRKINELLEENKNLNENVSESKGNNIKYEANDRNKYSKLMDLLTEIGEKEKNKEDLIIKILDLENKVNQLLMENEKLHKFIQEIKY